MPAKRLAHTLDHYEISHLRDECRSAFQIRKVYERLVNDNCVKILQRARDGFDFVEREPGAGGVVWIRDNERARVNVPHPPYDLAHAHPAFVFTSACSR